MSSFSISQFTGRWCRENNINVECFDSLTSTNDVAKSEAFAINETPKVYITDNQTSGRGRGENHWTSPAPGSSLMWSWSGPLDLTPQHITGPVVGVTLYQAAAEIWPHLEWSIKAPNDLYLKDKKVAGFLVEALHQEDRSWIVIGLGLNVFAHPEEVPHAGHIVSELGLSELSEEEWERFLNAFWVRMQKALTLVTATQLDVPHREALLKALNANPWKDQTFVDVSENGDLVGQDETIPWTSL